MTGNRLTRRLEQARSQGRKCLLPYVTAGYPDLETTTQLLRRLDDAGCQAIEIGVPFSDSIADGPVIQESFYRALDGGFKVDELFSAVAEVREQLSAALLIMVSMSIVRRRGVETFAKRAAASGFDGLIVPDVPADECSSLARQAQSCGLCNVLMAAPTSSDERRRRIAELSTGFVYLIAARGITGERRDLSADLANNVRRVRSLTALPLMVGFGISTAEHVRAVCREADGAIVGSAIIRRIADCLNEKKSRQEIIDVVGHYVDELITGTNGQGD